MAVVMARVYHTGTEIQKIPDLPGENRINRTNGQQSHRQQPAPTAPKHPLNAQAEKFFRGSPNRPRKKTSFFLKPKLTQTK